MADKAEIGIAWGLMHFFFWGGGNCWRVLPLGQKVITGCQVCLDTDGILYTNTSPQTAHRDQINNYFMLLVNSSGPITLET